MDRINQIEPLTKQTADNFLCEYIWVVLNSGMKEQIALKIFKRFIDSWNCSVIRHSGKRQAVEQAISKHKEWFTQLQQTDDKIDYLETLPWIGPTTKYHLARNIGIDTVKPDRHMLRLAEKFGYSGNPLEMCKTIQKDCGAKLGTIDVIMWRYCNLFGKNK
jgi:hypothetical protein